MAAGSRAFSLQHELARKTLHVLTIIIPLAYAAGLPRRTLVVLLAAVSGLAIVVEMMRSRHARTRAAFHRAVGHLLRPHEHERWAGATWLILSFLVVILVAPRAVAITAMWAVSAGDAAAALIGRAAGRRHIGRSRKTIIGSTACFLVTFAGAVLVAALTPAEGIVAALAATVAEWPRGGVDDNVRIVAAVAAVLMVCRVAFS